MAGVQGAEPPGLTPTHTHVIGAGLAGLAAALSLVAAGGRVTLWEAGPVAGGRCRSYFDRELGCRVDNGNHLLLSGNAAAMGFLRQVGALDTLTGPGAPVFPFHDVSTGEHWTVRPNMGRVPWWVLSRRRRVPGARLREFWPVMRLSRAPAEATVAERLGGGALYRRLLEPLTIAALNTMPETGSARLLGAVVDETLAAGGGACVPCWPEQGLSESFIDPAVAWLAARGAPVHTGRRVSGLDFAGGRVAALRFADGPVALGPEEAVVLAVPPWVATDLVPGISAPTEYESIANLHYRHDLPAAAMPAGAGFLGLIGGVAEWVFAKPGVLSVTISAANRWAERDNGDLAATVWRELCHALPQRNRKPAEDAMSSTVPMTMPPHRILREKRATFAATPAQDRLRPPARTRFNNLVLSGDWTATGLPATIEGAIRSGRMAADCLFQPDHQPDHLPC